MPTDSLPLSPWERPNRRRERAQQPVAPSSVESKVELRNEIAAPAVDVPLQESQRGEVVQAPSLFGATLSNEKGLTGGYKKAGVIAFGLHALVLGAAFAMPATPVTKSAPEEPEIVFLQFSPAPAAAGPKLAAVEPVQPQQQVVRAKPQNKPRPELAVPVVAPVQEREPEVAPVDEAPADPVEAAPSTAVASVAGGVEGGQGSGGTAAGDGVVPGGMGLGVFGDAAVPARQLAHPPSIVRRVEAAYPRWAERSGIQGRVIVRVIIGTDGKVEQDSVKVMRSIPELDEAAVVAARGWRFTPGRTAAGKVVRVIVDIPFQFTLR